MDKKKIGELLKRLREEKQKTQLQVATELSEYYIDVSDKAVAKWEKGNFPELDNLDIIADYYGVKPSDILNGEIYIPKNFEEEYFIVNNEWMKKHDADNLFLIRVEQEGKIKKRTKELFMKLIADKTLTKMENEELNFLLVNFYSVSQYFKGIDKTIGREKDKIKQNKILRSKIYREILSMHACSDEEIYWEIKKYYDYDKRVTFENTVCDYEDDIKIVEQLISELEDWEKDALLAQIQTQNIMHRYSRPSKLTYYRHFHREYDEERITKEGIKLLIRCGAQLNPVLLGYKCHEQKECDIIGLIKDLHEDIPGKLLVSKIGSAAGTLEYYWVDNVLKNRLLDLYYALNVSMEEKLSLDEVYNMFTSNNSIPKELLIKKVATSIKDDMTEKEILWLAEMHCPYEISKWDEAKKREQDIARKQEKLKLLEKLWREGERTYMSEEDKWVGAKSDVLMEQDILERLAQMSYEQYAGSRDKKSSERLLADIDNMSLVEIRQKFFPIEVRYEQK